MHRSITLFEPPTLRCQLSLQRGQNVSPGRGFPWKLERGVELWKSKSTYCGCHGPMGEGATRPRILASQPRPGIWGHRRPARTHAGPQPSPKFHPLHSAPGTRTRCTTAKQQNRRQTTAARLHFPLRNTRRQRLNLRPAVSTLGPSLHSILNSWFSSPRHIRQAVRHSVSVVLSRQSTLLSAALLIPCSPRP